MCTIILVNFATQISRDRQSVTLDYQRRFYDTTAFHPHARNTVTARQRVRLNAETHTFYVEQVQWRKLLRDIVFSDHVMFACDLTSIADDIRNRKQMKMDRDEVSRKSCGTSEHLKQFVTLI